MEQLRYPSNEELLKTYAQIETHATTAFKDGLVTGNSEFNRFRRAKNWSIFSQAFLWGSDAGRFLENALKVLSGSELFSASS